MKTKKDSASGGFLNINPIAGVGKKLTTKPARPIDVKGILSLTIRKH